MVVRCGTEGGLILMWTNKVSIKVMDYSSGHITGCVKGFGFQSCYFTGFYGNPDQSKRCHSWELLKRIRDMCLGPWFCI